MLLSKVIQAQMRRLLSMLLLAVFCFPLVTPLFATGTTSSRTVMACCRRDGKHHCAGTMAEGTGAVEQGIRLTAPLEKCPFSPVVVVTVNHDFPALAQSETNFALLLTRSSSIVQTESRRRISRDRSRQKRGPPALTFLA